MHLGSLVLECVRLGTVCFYAEEERETCWDFREFEESIRLISFHPPLSVHLSEGAVSCNCTLFV